ncbi:MAG: hypothetical protein CVV56_05945 [Tenericutes bacterium HGW-Tenericutes-1]|jgi:hypothetical protein|nr:MAG: hypothetical protein CVV56_05945 [Tenericutes bacterium HGW-Tenericutes-1]
MYNNAIFAIRWDIIIEVSILALVLLGALAVATILITRRLRNTYKDLYRQQSKFDIELRKSTNLISKVVHNESLDKYENVVIKDLPFLEKKELLDLVMEAFQSVDKEDEDNKYVIETYDNLHEMRRILDSKILSFNKLISIFPFNFYANILKMQKKPYYTHNE